MSSDNLFQPTLDLPGVLGVFCLNPSGKVLANYLPSSYRDSIFRELGARCTTLLQAVDMSYTPIDEYLLRFEDHSLYLRKTDVCIVGVLCAGDVMLAGLRVSINLLLKSGQEEILGLPVIESAASEPFNRKAPEVIEESQDDIITLKKNDETVTESGTKEKRRGLFGFGGKKKANPSNDIWG